MSLKHHKSTLSRIKGPVVLAIMDGVGIGRKDKYDAVFKADTPHLDTYQNHAFKSSLITHGTLIGMPTDSDMGNSEVGHMVMGSGRTFSQGAKRVQEAILSEEIFQGKTWKEMIAYIKRSNGAIHLIGLLSDGNVHSHIDHLIALIKRAHSEEIEKLYIHAILDGRDVHIQSALSYIKKIESLLENIVKKDKRDYKIVSGGGRMRITMDRYGADWSMVERGWKAHVLGKGRVFNSLSEGVSVLRKESLGTIDDQNLDAMVISKNGHSTTQIKDGDATLIFNFRGDRVLQLCDVFTQKKFSKFDRKYVPDIFFAGMIEYDPETHRPKNFLVSTPPIKNNLQEFLCSKGISQLACSETQKFGHITYFWNGARSGYLDKKLEKYIEVPSLSIPFKKQPEMQADKITENFLKELITNKYDFGRLNYANGDMIGHTGDFDATRLAIESVDSNIGKLSKVVLDMDGALVITADHGNSEDMVLYDKNNIPILDSFKKTIPKTSHSLNPVPFYLVTKENYFKNIVSNQIKRPHLGHVAGTLLELLGLRPPSEYMPSLLKFRS